MAWNIPLIENKVTGATVGAGASTIVSNFFLWVMGNYFHAGVPMEVSSMLSLLLGVAGAFVGGFIARHTPRPDLVFVPDPLPIPSVPAPAVLPTPPVPSNPPLGG